MATLNFLNASVQGTRTVQQPVLEPGQITVVRNYIDCTQQSIDAGDGDVAQVVQVPAETLVLDCFLHATTAETADATCDLGYGSDADYWGANLNLDVTGAVPTILTGSTTWDAGSIAAAPAMLSGTATWDAGSIPSAPAMLSGTATWDAAAIAMGSMEAKDITVTGAAVGDRVIVTPSIDVTDLTLTATVTAANTVTAVLANNTAGAVDLAPMTITAYVISGAAMEAKEITVTGAALGDRVIVTPSVDVADLTLTGFVTAADTVTAVLSNTTGAAVDLASMTITAYVISGTSIEAKDITVAGASLGDKVTAIPSIDVTDLMISASVTAEDTVTVVLSNTTGTAVNLASMTMSVVVDKGNKRGQPLYFSSADTIDITAKTTNGDVDIDGFQGYVIATMLSFKQR